MLCFVQSKSKTFQYMLQLAKRPAMTRASQAFDDVELYFKRGKMVTTLP
jgi:hypothetical protein